MTFEPDQPQPKELSDRLTKRELSHLRFVVGCSVHPTWATWMDALVFEFREAKRERNSLRRKCAAQAREIARLRTLTGERL